MKKYKFVLIISILTMFLSIQILYLKNSNKVEFSTDELVFNDIIDGSDMKCYSQDNEISLLALDSKDSCIDYCHSHGPGREKGGNGLLANGCRNYMSNSYSYSSTDIPFWINMTSFNQVSDSNNREKMISDIRTQIAFWNTTRLHDISSNVVNFYEVGQTSLTRPSDINGKKVLEFNQTNLSSQNAVGMFYPNTVTISLSYDNSKNEIQYNVDTIMHELGHVLGLADIDSDTNSTYGTHKTLMGYNRGTSVNDLYKAIKYSDIQGAAVTLGNHINHQYYGYVLNGNKYDNICFYCDRIDEESQPIGNAKMISSSSECVHSYRTIASSGPIRWERCENCYCITEIEEEMLVDLDGDGVYEIYTQNQLNQIQTQPDGGAGRTYKLMQNIQAEPYMQTVYFPSILEFKGVFDGNNHTLYLFKIKTNTTGNYGFCGINYGTIKNLCLGILYDINSDCTNINVGSFAGINKGTIYNCSTFASYNRPFYKCYAKGESYAGCFVGINDGVIDSCKGGDWIYGSCNMGTVAGKNTGTIQNCDIGYSGQEIDYSYRDYNSCVGGIVGLQTSGVVKNCSFQGNVLWTNSLYSSSTYSNYSENREMQPCIGIIIGRKQGGTTSGNSWTPGNRGTNVIVLSYFTPSIITWKTGWWLWKETHTHNQGLYFNNTECGRIG